MIYIFFVFVLGFMLFVAWHVVKYRNPYKLYMVFGGKGSGKTTLMTKLAYQHIKKGWYVYSSTEIPGVSGVRVFDIKQLGFRMFPENSLVLVDEVGLIWDNRHYKDFKDEVKRYFKYQRQYKNRVYLFSQAFDVDKKIRDLTDHIYICQNYFNFMSIARRVTKKITIVHADKSAQGESKIADDYTLDPLLLAFFGSIVFTYIPRWAKLFNSYDPPQLPCMGYVEEELPERRRGTLVRARAERSQFVNWLNSKTRKMR